MSVPAESILDSVPRLHGVFSNRDIHFTFGEQPRATDTSCMSCKSPGVEVLVK